MSAPHPAVHRLADMSPPSGVKREIGRDGWDLGVADFSLDGKHRYFLGRYWDPGLPTVLWILINPSVAGATGGDPTARKVRGFSERLGCGGFEIINLFSLVSTDPRGLRALPPGVTVLEHWYWQQAAKAYYSSSADIWNNSRRMVIAGWGAKKLATQREPDLLKVLAKVHLSCLGLTKGGQPNHPLMLAYATKGAIYRAVPGSIEAEIQASSRANVVPMQASSVVPSNSILDSSFADGEKHE